MDLLQGAAGHVTGEFTLKQFDYDPAQSPLGAKSSRRRQPGQDATHFKTDEKTGKLIIDKESDFGNAGEDGNGEDEVIVGNAYKESMTSVDGFTRGAGGRIKFNKDTKKRRREEIERDDDVEMADAENISAGKKSKKIGKSEPRLGHEFKAKVCQFPLSTKIRPDKFGFAAEGRGRRQEARPRSIRLPFLVRSC